jgi:hypothetical protein
MALLDVSQGMARIGVLEMRLLAQFGGAQVIA